MRYIILLALFGFTFFACKKNENKCTPSNTEFTGKWRWTSWKVTDKSTGASVDYIQACNADDVVTMNADGTYSWADNTVTCTWNPNRTGTWTTNSSVMTVDGITYNILSYDCTTLVLEKDNVPQAGQVTRGVVVKIP